MTQTGETCAPPFAGSVKARVPGLADDGETHDQIGRRHMVAGFFRPFDATHGVVAEIFGQACIDKFFRITESIKIKVI